MPRVKAIFEEENDEILINISIPAQYLVDTISYLKLLIFWLHLLKKKTFIIHEHENIMYMVKHYRYGYFMIDEKNWLASLRYVAIIFITEKIHAFKCCPWQLIYS